MKPEVKGLPLARTIAPADSAALVETVRDAYRNRVPIYPIGGGTSLDYGVLPKRQGLGLSLAGLSEVIDFPARDLTVTAQAGVAMATLSAQLATEGLRLPVDVPQADRATLGGVVACSPSGPRRYGWGTMRDYVIGLTAVDGYGTSFSAGGRVVKNAAGYDLCRLITGSLGTLGVITQATLMVKPIPQSSALVAAEVADPVAAERLLADLVQSKILPTAVELLAGPAWHDDPVLGFEGAADRLSIVVGLEGTTAEVNWMVDELTEHWKQSPNLSPRTIAGADADRLWNSLTEFPACGGSQGDGGPLVVRISVLPGQVASMVRQLVAIDPACSIQAHAGNGVLRVRFSWTPEEVAGGMEKQLRPAVATATGNLTVLACPTSAELSHETAWGAAIRGATVMQSIKEKFDPKNILNPGRFIFPDQ